MVAITSEEQNKVKRIFKKTEDSLRDLWDNFKCISIRILWIPEEEEKNKGYEKNFEEIIVENFLNMERVNKVQEAQTIPYRIKPRRKRPRQILIKLTKTEYKERILKAAMEKQQVTYKGNLIHLFLFLLYFTLQYCIGFAIH